MMREFWGSAQAPEFFALVQGWLGHAGGGERFRSPLILASGSALGSLSGVALSSVRLLAAPRDGLGANFLNRDVKMEYSRDLVPLDPKLVSVLKDWRQRAPLKEDTDWLFANPRTGKPYHQEGIQKKHLKKAAIAAGIRSEIGWHTFRHTYRSWLDASGAPLKVQQELMRHASITTTMNVYGKAMPSIKRKANSKVVSMVLKKRKGKLLVAAS